jgi:Ca2+-binding EF-hand superfamily protein
MSGISSLSGLSTVASTIGRSADSSKLQQKLLEKIDSNSDGSIDKTELSSFMEYVDSKTGSTGSDVDAVFKSLDADSDGSVSSDEFAANSDSLIDQLRDQLRSAQMGSGARPPPPPGPPPDEAGQSDDLFAKIDTNSDGSIDETELSTFFSQQEQQTEKPAAGGSPLDAMLASLIQQYQTVSTSSAYPSTTSSLSEVA